jgi:hypothetical protein
VQNNSKGAMELILSGDDETLAIANGYSFEQQNDASLSISMKPNRKN